MDSISDMVEGEEDVEEEYSVDEITEEVPELERRLITQPYDLSVKTLVQNVKDGDLVLKDYYQRNYVWDNAKASKLIESLILNIPIPVCYFSEEENGVFTVIDGHQRIKSICRYVNNEFKLRNLDVKAKLNRSSFNGLDKKDRRRILSRTLRCIVIAQESDPEIRFDVFERLNTGAVILRPQEIRNCIYRGSLNELLSNLANDENWLKCRNRSTPDKRMKDQELILRFFAIRNGFNDYKPYMKTFLNQFMRANRTMSKDKIRHLEDCFKNTISLLYEVFGENCFKKYDPNENSWEKGTNTALFDTLMLSFSQFSERDIADKKETIYQLYQEIQTKAEFMDAVDRATGDRSRLLKRLSIWNEELKKIGLDTGLHIPEK